MISIEYYNLFLKGDPLKISKMKNLIKEDLKKSEAAFFKADNEKNIQMMKMELHKISPIIFNLRYQDLLAVIEKYKEHTQYDSDELKKLNERLKKYLDEVYTFLGDS